MNGKANADDGDKDDDGVSRSKLQSKAKAAAKKKPQPKAKAGANKKPQPKAKAGAKKTECLRKEQLRRKRPPRRSRKYFC